MIENQQEIAKQLTGTALYNYAKYSNMNGNVDTLDIDLLREQDSDQTNRANKMLDIVKENCGFESFTHRKNAQIKFEEENCTKPNVGQDGRHEVTEYNEGKYYMLDLDTGFSRIEFKLYDNYIGSNVEL